MRKCASCGCSLRSVCPACRRPPKPSHGGNDGLDRDGVLLVRTEIPSLGVFTRRFAQPLGEQQVAGERFEHVLPRTHRLRVAHLHGFAGDGGAHRVRNEPVRGPVAAADHVAGARGGERRAVAAKNERR